MPGTPCRGDVFHAQMDMGDAVTYLRNRALGAISAREHLDQRMARARQNQRGRNLSFKLAAARKEEARAVRLASDVETLADWLSNDVLGLGGPDYDTRRLLFDFIVEELKAREAPLRQKLGGRFHAIFEVTEQLAHDTVRASSVIENLDSRLRCYFFRHRHLGPDYLDLLRFFLHHRRFLRSRHPERVGQSPAELLADEPHPHWLEILGFERFSRD